MMTLGFAKRSRRFTWSGEYGVMNGPAYAKSSMNVMTHSPNTARRCRTKRRIISRLRLTISTCFSSKRGIARVVAVISRAMKKPPKYAQCGRHFEGLSRLLAEADSTGPEGRPDDRAAG